MSRDFKVGDTIDYHRLVLMDNLRLRREEKRGKIVAVVPADRGYFNNFWFDLDNGDRVGDDYVLGKVRTRLLTRRRI